MSMRVLRIDKRWIVLAVLALIAGAGWSTFGIWRPAAERQLAALHTLLSIRGGGEPEAGVSADNHSDKDHDSHEHAGHDHAGHDESASLELSGQAQRNIGLRVAEVRLGTFVRSVTIPGIVVERRGFTKTRVVAPLTGIVRNVHVIEGEALRPGQPLFDLRMTHEDLLQAQVEFLKITEELDVVNREVERLRPVAEKGAIPQKTLLDRLYEQQKLEASLRAQRESLLLHGLSAEQVAEISKDRALRSDLTIYAPQRSPKAGTGTTTAGGVASLPVVREPLRREAEGGATAANGRRNGRLYVVNELNVENGRLVTAGDPLLTLADYSELYVEGNAFEQDGQLVADALKKGWKVTAVVENHTPAGTTVPDLSILYLSDEVDPASRTLHFYMRLPNERIRDETTDGHHFINWRFKPGQRTHLRVPVEEWPDRIVLPADAVAQDGPESYVFQQNGDHFDRRPVQVEYRDLESAVIAQDGSLFPGDRVAMSGAQQMLMALKNKAGGGIDPHAGHNH